MKRKVLLSYLVYQTSRFMLRHNLTLSLTRSLFSCCYFGSGMRFSIDTLAATVPVVFS